MSATTKSGNTFTGRIGKDLHKIPYMDRIYAIDIVSDELHFIGKDPNTRYWVYVGGSDREVRVFDKFIDALAYGLHVSPEEIRSIDVVETGDYYIKLRICTVEECDIYKAYIQ